MDSKHDAKHKHNSPNIAPVLATIAIAISLFNALVVFGAASEFGGKLGALEESLKPAGIRITQITLADCNDCFDVSQAAAIIKKANVKVLEEKKIDAGSADAKALVAKYGIARLPALVVSGELNKSAQHRALFGALGNITGDAVVFRDIPPVYFDTAKNEFVGRISITYLQDSSKAFLINYLPPFIAQLGTLGIKVSSSTALEYNGSEGIALVRRYNITRVPTMILSKGAADYPAIAQAWPQIGSVEADGAFVSRSLTPPYLDLAANKSIGAVTLLKITDRSCGECYDVATIQTFFARQGMGFEDVLAYDISSEEGKRALANYNITKVPTVVLSPDAGEYKIPAIVAWKTIGSVEQNGWYVLRDLGAVQGAVYRDLLNGTIVRPANATG